MAVGQIGLSLFERPGGMQNFATGYKLGADQRAAQQQESRNAIVQGREDTAYNQQQNSQAIDQLGAVLDQVKDGDAQGFESAKAFAVQNKLIDERTASQYTVNDLPRIRALSQQARTLAKQRSDTDMQQQEFGLKKRVGEANIAQSYASAARDKAAASESGLESWGQEDIDYAGYIYNHTGQMPPLGQGKEGSAARKAILKSARIQAGGEGGAANTVANFADFAGAKSGLRTLGGRAANIDTAAAEAKNFAGQAIDASRRVPRGSFVPLNQLVQAGQVATSDPALAYFATKALGLAGAAATVAGRGTTNQFLQEEYFKKLSTAPDAKAFEETARAILEEAKGVSESTQEVRQDMLGNLRGKKPEAASGVIKYDAQGRRIP